jgi:hypothetical protein
MLNPFLQTQSAKKRRLIMGGNEEFVAQLQGHTLDSMSPRPSLGLWIGRLLIRMGKKLSKEDIALKSDREHV